MVVTQLESRFLVVDPDGDCGRWWMKKQNRVTSSPKKEGLNNKIIQFQQQPHIWFRTQTSTTSHHVNDS